MFGPCQVTLADTSTMHVINTHVRALQRPRHPHADPLRTNVLTHVLIWGWHMCQSCTRLLLLRITQRW